MKRKLLSLLLAAVMSLSLSACTISNEKPTETTTAQSQTTAEDSGVKVVNDREGGTVEISGELNKIVSAAPSVTEILVGLGLKDKIIAADTFSADVEGIDASICTVNFYNLNLEAIVAMEPDAVIVNGISMVGADDPYTSLKEAGILVLYIPTAESIEAVKKDISFLSECTGTETQGQALISNIDTALNDIKGKAAGITDKKTVYFELGAAPQLYSCGSDTFINEIITLVGGENIYASESGWLSNSEETVIAANPDVIITSVMYDGYDFNEIKNRAGWDSIKAVKDGYIYQVNPNAVSRPSQNVVTGIYEVAKAIYPEVY